MKIQRRRPTVKDIEIAAMAAINFGGNVVGVPRVNVMRACGGDERITRILVRLLISRGVTIL